MFFRDYESTFIVANKSVSIHKVLVTEIFKTKNGLYLAIIEDVFKFKNLTYNFRNAETHNRSKVNSNKYKTEGITFLGAKIWKVLPNNYEELTFLSTFKSKIKNWEKDEWPSRLCKIYNQWVGLIWLGIVMLDQCSFFN